MSIAMSREVEPTLWNAVAMLPPPGSMAAGLQRLKISALRSRAADCPGTRRGLTRAATGWLGCEHHAGWDASTMPIGVLAPCWLGCSHHAGWGAISTLVRMRSACWLGYDQYAG